MSEVGTVRLSLSADVTATSVRSFPGRDGITEVAAADINQTVRDRVLRQWQREKENVAI